MINDIKKRIKNIATIGLLVGMCSCGAIYEESDCVESSTTLTFTYNMNLKHADAFDWAVKSVHVLMFEPGGTLRYEYRVPKSSLLGGNKLAINVEPGDYDVLVWAGDYDKNTTLGTTAEIGKSKLEDFHLKVNRGELGHIENDIEHVFHSLRRVHLPYASPQRPHNEVFNLTKDTNSVRIVLQQLSGVPVDMSSLNISITDDNGWLHHDNSLRDDEMLTYHPWYLKSGSVEILKPFNQKVNSRSESLGAMVGELTVSRLMTTSKPRVNVKRADGKLVLSVPLIDYALLVKGNYDQKMDDQEYLDRQDEYNMTFFLDDRMEWISTQIIINDWVVVPDQTDVEGDY